MNDRAHYAVRLAVQVQNDALTKEHAEGRMADLFSRGVAFFFLKGGGGVHVFSRDIKCHGGPSNKHGDGLHLFLFYQNERGVKNIIFSFLVVNNKKE